MYLGSIVFTLRTTNSQASWKRFTLSLAQCFGSFGDKEIAHTDFTVQKMNSYDILQLSLFHLASEEAAGCEPQCGFSPFLECPESSRVAICNNVTCIVVWS
jgi:hypothetical protein